MDVVVVTTVAAAAANLIYIWKELTETHHLCTCCSKILFRFWIIEGGMREILPNIIRIGKFKEYKSKNEKNEFQYTPHWIALHYSIRTFDIDSWDCYINNSTKRKKKRKSNKYFTIKAAPRVCVQSNNSFIIPNLSNFPLQGIVVAYFFAHVAAVSREEGFFSAVTKRTRTFNKIIK
jgi:hypothetical protein